MNKTKYTGKRISPDVECKDCNGSGAVQTGEDEGVPIYSECHCTFEVVSAEAEEV